MNYQLTSSATILRLDDGALIPPAPGNNDFAAYRAWVSAGNTPTPYVAPVTAPTTQITPFAFVARLTPSEQLAIATAAQSNATALLWLMKMAAAAYVDTTDPLTGAGVQMMVSAGLLTAPRATQILNFAVSSP